MKIRLSCLIIALLFATTAVQAYRPGDFPGQGKYVDWYDAVSFYHQGLSLQHNEKYDQAIEQFNQAITRYATDSRFFQGLGSTYLDRGHGGDTDMAIQAYRQATIVNNSEWSTFNALANLHEKLGQKHEALVEYRHALECHPPTRQAKSLHAKIAELEKETPTP